jgi:hypothetical protein
MRIYTVDASKVDEKFTDFFVKLMAPHVSQKYASYFIEICNIFANAVEEEEDYFIVSEDGILFDINVNVDELKGSTWVETLTGDDMTCVMYSVEFAKMYLHNIDLRAPHSVVVRGMFPEYKTNKIAVNYLSLVNQDLYDRTWGPNVYNFLRGFSCTNVKLINILNDYDKVMKRKEEVEESFEKKYGVKLDIRDYKYILKDE